MKKISIGLRFTLWYLATLLLAEIILGVGAWLNVRQSFFELADTSLEGQAADLKRFLDSRVNLPAAQLKVEVGENFRVERSRDYLQINAADGNLIYRSQFFSEHPLPPLPLDDLDRPAYAIHKLGPERVRVISEQVALNGVSCVVRIGHPMNEEYESLMDLRRSMLWYGFLIFLVASAAAYWISRRRTSCGDPSPAVSD
jgi:hypothetical protein